MGVVLASSKWEWYIPYYRGNRYRYLSGQDPNPMKVKLKLPTYAEHQANMRVGRLMDDKEQGAWLADHIGEFQNLVLEEGTVVGDGKQLMAMADQVDGDLILELDRVLGSAERLEEGLARKLSPQPGSSDFPKGSSGTAETAESGGSGS